MTNSDELPPLSPLTGQPATRPPGFPPAAWDPEAKAQAAMADFMTFDWRAAIGLPEPPSDDRPEASELLGRMPERAARLAEITAQDSDTLADWAALIGPVEKFPWTVSLLLTARAVGHVLAMYYKRSYARLRPYQVLTNLEPPMIGPKTPSYPGVHATEAYLMSAVLAQVMQQESNAGAALAARIAENREIAGLNYPSDNQAGQSLATSALAMLKSANGFSQILAAAQGEWRDNGHAAVGIFDPDEDGGSGW